MIPLRTITDNAPRHCGGMEFFMKYTAAVITVSDKGARGEREDWSGPALCALLKENGYEIRRTTIIPDDAEAIRSELLYCADELRAALILTTGGTGFSPRDITPEAASAVFERNAPGIPEAMRAESMKITPKACLSRSVAGIRGRSLIITLPGSPKAAVENITPVLPAVEHGLEMLLSEGSADCAAEQSDICEKKSPEDCTAERYAGNGIPSFDTWAEEARQCIDAEKTGVFLSHHGIVRASSRKEIREGIPTAPVSAMILTPDRVKAEAALDEARKMEGISFLRMWINEGRLSVGEDIMKVMVGADTRPHAEKALWGLVEKLKKECLHEEEIFC